MKLRTWLTKIPQGVAPAVIVGIEAIAGLVIHYYFGKFDTWRDVASYVAACGLVALLIHLLVEFNRIPRVVVKKWAQVASEGDRQSGPRLQQMLRWIGLIAGFDKRGISSDFLDGFMGTLDTLAVPKQVESMFLATLRKEAGAMSDLAGQKPVEKHLDTQYIYAGGVAAYYESRAPRGSTVYATALDPPAQFYEKQRGYFEQQDRLQTFTRSFVPYAQVEVANLRVINDKTGETLKRNRNPPVEKARIVLIDKEALAAELTKDQFWSFVTWHARSHFGLKFFIRDLENPQKSRGPKWYEKELMRRTELEADDTIDDFIVYGDECVFGRIDREVRQDKVRLRFLYLNDDPAVRTGHEEKIPIYRDFFVDLWGDEALSYTLTDLAALPDFEAVIGQKSKDVSNLINAYVDAAFEVAEIAARLNR